MANPPMPSAPTSKQDIAPDIYLYGMTVLSTIHKLRGAMPETDGYGEIEQSWLVPGGETMNAAIVLSQLGARTAIGGPWLGAESAPVIRHYAERYGIDCSSVSFHPDWTGVRDLVLVDHRHRTVFGWFGKFFSTPPRRWDPPNERLCRAAGIVSIDPYFQEDSVRAAEICAAAGRPYVTIDCPADSPLHRHAAATVVSREFRRGHYPNRPEDGLMEEYRSTAAGLVVFSAGQEPIRYARKDGSVSSAPPFQVEVRSTLGAGDVFRAGIVYGLYKRMSDAETVRFAAATAAVACTRMPIADHPPALAEIQELLSRRGRS